MFELLHGVRVVCGAVLVRTTDLIIDTIERVHEHRKDSA